MSLVNLYEKLNKIKNNSLKDVPIVTHSTLSVVDNVIEFELNGTPSSIIINYSGAGRFVSKMPITIKTKIGKTIILISNIFREEIPKVIFEYIGNISIYNCYLMNFDGSKIKVTINNTQEEQLLNKANTNMEDDSLVLYDTPREIVRRPFKTGIIKPKIDKSLINDVGKIQKFGKPDVEKISTVIKRLVPAVGEKTRYRISPLLNETSQLPIRDLDITKTKLTPQTVFKPVKKEKGGKY